MISNAKSSHLFNIIKDTIDKGQYGDSPCFQHHPRYFVYLPEMGKLGQNENRKNLFRIPPKMDTIRNAISETLDKFTDSLPENANRPFGHPVIAALF